MGISYTTRDAIKFAIVGLEADAKLQALGLHSGSDAVNELEIARRTLAAYEEFDSYVREVASFYQISIHGDLYRFGSGVEFDLEFPGTIEAVTFVNSVLNPVATEASTFVEPKSSLLEPITLTVRFGSRSPLNANLRKLLNALR